MLSYRAILKQAWKISWKYKFLWFFGLFASLVSFTAEMKVISQSLNQEMGMRTLNNIKIFLETGILSGNTWGNIVKLFQVDTISILIVLLIFLLILAGIIFFAWVSTVSQIGIISSVNKIVKKRREVLNIRKGIKAGNKKFWPVFGMNVIISLVIGLISLLTSYLLVLAVSQDQTTMILFYGLTFIIFVPISLFFSFIIKYAITYSILENKKFCNAIKQGWRLFIKNWIISIEMTIILFFINIIAIALLSFLSFVTFVIVFGLAWSTAIAGLSPIFFWVLATLSGLLSLILIILGASILNVFQISSWTDLFIELRKNKNDSKLERIFKTEKKS
jgi:hypothetical protein